MSSILDALNKVEEDRNALDNDADVPFVPEQAAEVLCASHKNRRRSGRRSLLSNGNPYAYAAGMLCIIAVIIGLSLRGVFFVEKSISSTVAVAAAAKPAAEASAQPVAVETHPLPAPETAPSPALSDVTPKPEETPVPQVAAQAKPAPPSEARTPAPEPVKPAAEPPAPPKPEPPVEAKAPAPEPVKAVVEKPAPKAAPVPVRIAKAVPPPLEEPTTPLPTAEAIERARGEVIDEKPPVTAPVHGPPTSFAPGRAAEKSAPLLEDINSLPRLGQTERERLGLGEMRLNVLREASASQPEGLAIINLKKVYVGEMIPGTNARLIAVKTRAIAIEIEGTGERFKVMN